MSGRFPAHATEPLDTITCRQACLRVLGTGLPDPPTTKKTVTLWVQAGFEMITGHAQKLHKAIPGKTLRESHCKHQPF